MPPDTWYSASSRNVRSVFWSIVHPSGGSKNVMAVAVGETSATSHTH
jgi:hypothetical protein